MDRSSQIAALRSVTTRFKDQSRSSQIAALRSVISRFKDQLAWASDKAHARAERFSLILDRLVEESDEIESAERLDPPVVNARKAKLNDLTDKARSELVGIVLYYRFVWMQQVDPAAEPSGFSAVDAARELKAVGDIVLSLAGDIANE